MSHNMPPHHRFLPRRGVLPIVGLLSVLVCSTWGPAAHAQDNPVGTDAERQKPPALQGARKIQLSGKYKIRDLVKYFADLMEQNFVLEEKGLTEEVEIISHRSVSVQEGYQAFLSALEMAGYSTVTVGSTTQIVKTSEAAQSPVVVGQGGEIPYTAAFVTQIISLDNVQVSDINSVVTQLASAEAKIIAYAPTNTMIITDTAHNLRKVYRIISQLDVAAPRSRLRIVPLQYADAAEVAQIIQEVYAVGQEAEAAPTTRSRSRSRRSRRDETPETTQGVTAGKETSYISKVLSDERTNSLIVLANEEGMEAIQRLIKRLDVDVDLSGRTQIHVVYLEHAKAEDVAGVLANLSQSDSSQQARRTTAATRARTTGSRGAEDAGNEESTGVTAAFDSGMRITHDENTNSLVIIASPEDFRIVGQVIEQLDIRRRQVFVDAVILELSGEDEFEMGLGFHGPAPSTDGGFSLFGSQLGASSLGLTQDLLSGLAVGVFGESIEVPFTSGTTVTNVSVPAFGVVLSALRSNSLVNIVSNPNVLALDNEEATITIGRKIPFPTSSGLNSLGQPVVSYQREDVATELKITPRINSSNHVTLEVSVEVSEVEEDSSGLNVNQAGFITSKRQVETQTLVADDQTIVLGGLVGTTDTEVETKVPLLGDLPLIGGLFRGTKTKERRSNLLIFLTPHIIDDEADMVEVMRIKEAQRQEFIRRFYGRSQAEQLDEMKKLLSYSMNFVDEPRMYRARSLPTEDGGESSGTSEEPLAVPQPYPLPIGPLPDDAVVGPEDEDDLLMDVEGLDENDEDSDEDDGEGDSSVPQSEEE